MGRTLGPLQRCALCLAAIVRRSRLDVLTVVQSKQGCSQMPAANVQGSAGSLQHPSAGLANGQQRRFRIGHRYGGGQTSFPRLPFPLGTAAATVAGRKRCPLVVRVQTALPSGAARLTRPWPALSCRVVSGYTAPSKRQSGSLRGKKTETRQARHTIHPSIRPKAQEHGQQTTLVSPACRDGPHHLLV